MSVSVSVSVSVCVCVCADARSYVGRVRNMYVPVLSEISRGLGFRI